MAIQLASAGCFRVVYGLEERAQPWVWGRSGGAVGQVQTTRDIGAMAQYSGRRQGRQQRGEESERQQGPSRKGGRSGRGGEKEGGARRAWARLRPEVWEPPPCNSSGERIVWAEKQYRVPPYHRIVCHATISMCMRWKATWKGGELLHHFTLHFFFAGRMSPIHAFRKESENMQALYSFAEQILLPLGPWRNPWSLCPPGRAGWASDHLYNWCAPPSGNIRTECAVPGHWRAGCILGSVQHQVQLLQPLLCWLSILQHRGIAV